MKYYMVKAKCGHVRRSNYIIVVYPVMANNGKEAAAMVRQFPRVKHDHKDAIMAVNEISHNEYKILRMVNNYDNYLRCTSRQEQIILCEDMEYRVHKEEREEIDYVESRQMKKNKLAKNRYSLKYIECAERKASMKELAYCY